MHEFRSVLRLLGLMLAGCLTVASAHAQTFVSRNGTDIINNNPNTCTRSSPCQGLIIATGATPPGGTLVVLDANSFTNVFLGNSITIVNETSGTALVCCTGGAPASGATGQIVIAANFDGVVTLRGLTFDSPQAPNTASVLISNARQVNIENCSIRNATGPAILIAPNQQTNSSPPSSIAVNIKDTTITGSSAGIKITSVPGVPVSVAIDRARIENNLGAGVRADGTIGGPITVSVSDSVIALNGSNGVLALSGAGDVTVDVTRSVIASNTLSGVQSNQTGGGVARVTVRGSTLTNNAGGAMNFFGGGTLLTFGDNNVSGPNGTGFSGPAALQ